MIIRFWRLSTLDHYLHLTIIRTWQLSACDNYPHLSIICTWQLSALDNYLHLTGPWVRGSSCCICSNSMSIFLRPSSTKNSYINIPIQMLAWVPSTVSHEANGGSIQNASGILAIVIANNQKLTTTQDPTTACINCSVTYLFQNCC